MKKGQTTIELVTIGCLIIGIIYACNMFLNYYQNKDKQYSAKEICKIIWIIEGRNEANQHYGINPKYIKCNSKEKCKYICINTVENNKIRFTNQNKETHFLNFLAKKYCPYNWKTWLKNLKYYLTKE